MEHYFICKFQIRDNIYSTNSDALDSICLEKHAVHSTYYPQALKEVALPRRWKL